MLTTKTKTKTKMKTSLPGVVFHVAARTHEPRRPPPGGGSAATTTQPQIRVRSRRKAGFVSLAGELAHRARIPRHGRLADEVLVERLWRRASRIHGRGQQPPFLQRRRHQFCEQGTEELGRCTNEDFLLCGRR